MKTANSYRYRPASDASPADISASPARRSSGVVSPADAVTGDATASSDDELQQYFNAGFLFAAFDQQAIPIGFGGGYMAEHRLHIGEVDDPQVRAFSPESVLRVRLHEWS
ncbi:hypothetical protein [Rhizobium sp. BK060]|uniref:hypothetical protein n=1 Tax=Rhizobium sp. BK060 TaxID=2587096 RepID=UPI001620AAF9|nr:hypothetical protein [Rhizobium sp. BK060]MBB3397282.1 hypothetical protein [Rhizobium sp. BK060]